VTQPIAVDPAREVARERTMKAFVRSRYGSPDVLTLEDVELPEVKDGDVLVRIRAASLNQADLDYLTGTPLLTRMGTGIRKPRNRGLGLDVAGIVEAVGKGVTAFKPGDEVFGDLTEFGYGAFAELASAPERAWSPKPAGLTMEEAATIPQSAILALQGLRSGKRIRRGDKVLINGASGNLGPFAVQIAKALGAEVTGVSSTAKMDMVRAVGADHVIDYTSEDYTKSGQRYDWIVDAVGNRSLLAARRALKRGGTYVMVGGSTRGIFAALLLGPFISLLGRRKVGLMMWWKPFKKDDVALLKELIAAGRIAPVIDRRYPLAEVPDALRYLASGQARGKVVITIS
jgi:NADPH:quinone reductase-like Zn-dependent oxidoreductase